MRPPAKKLPFSNHRKFLEILCHIGDNKSPRAIERRANARERAMTANSLPELDRYRSRLRLLAEIELSPRLRVKEDASDIVQQSLLEAHRDLPAFRGQTDAELYGWLKTILARNLLNVARHYHTQGRDIDLEHQVTGVATC